MIIYNLDKIAAITGGSIDSNGQITVRHLLTDSRTVTMPGSSIFFALTGRNHDGHDYIPELYNKGIRAFVVSRSPDFRQNFPDAGFILADDPLKALQALAAYHRSQFTCPVVGITGSNGKTIVKEWLYHCLEDNFNITRSPKSYNSQIGVPLSLWLMDQNTELGLFEAGISMPGEMKNLRNMIKPDIGIFTNIGDAHQENFKGMEQKTGEKLRLFYGCKTLIYCNDHQVLRKAIEDTPELSGTERFSWSATGKADLQISGLIRKSHSTVIKAIYRHRQIEVTIPFSDNASLENAVHCLSLLLVLGIGEETIVRKMQQLPPVAMRLEQKSGINGCTLINDSYNSDINSLSIALDYLKSQLQHKKKTLVLSDIFQTGKRPDELYRTVSAMITEKGVTRFIGIGNELFERSGFFDIPSSFFRTTGEFLADFRPEAFRDEAILIKGARQFEFEKISSLLELKKNTTRIEINLSALIHNLNYFRSLLSPGTKMMVMVKALSYGSGSHEIANILQHQGVNYLGVAFADEGVALRRSGITIPVIVMNPEPESFDMMIRNRLEPEIFSIRNLRLFSEAVNRNQEVNYPLHIKLDTGMHRLGFMENDTEELCTELAKYRNIKVASVFSHLAGSDEAAYDKFTEGQINLFEKMSSRIISCIGYDVIRHILNTSGIERFGHACYDMVRLGIGLYGVSSVSPEKLRNVSTLKSTILQIKHLWKGETVGYSRKGKITGPSDIAVVPIGYADGLDRKLGNGKGFFMVNGKRAPVTGNICMDMTMIDVTGCDAKEGDEVIFFGDVNPVANVAGLIGTIPYEVLTGISERVKRVYYYD